MFHPLQSDEDAPHDDLMVARARAALAWGAMQGRLAHLPPEVAHHFCCALTRLAIIEALGPSGYPGAEAWFSLWFAGLDPVPGVSAHTTAPASLIAETLLGELMLSSWGPLAHAATQIRDAARFDRDDRRDSPSPALALVVEEAAGLANNARIEAGGPNTDDAWPLAALDRLTQAAAASPNFAPTDREYRVLDLPAGPVALEQAGATPPLWLLDLVAGAVVAPDNPGSRPLPLPGAVRAEALKPHWWPRERAILVADTARVAAQKLTVLVDAAFHAVADMEQLTTRLRSTSRAPVLFRLLSGFGPLRPIQIERAIAISKNGVRELVATLIKAGLAEMSSHHHQAIVCAITPQSRSTHVSAPKDEPGPLADDKFAEFDAAMADIDRLLSRSNGSNKKA